ncbi:MAG: hypothetical protein KC561_21910, partial [Myxococcales bacterium]|nr:hypothetical protein [Myxococcales bacterium]
IHKFISRIKAEEEIWNKVCDEIFQLDELVIRDKELRSLSRYVKDVFGVKIVVSAPERVDPLYRALKEFQFSDESLAQARVPASDATRTIEWIETKNYMGERKGSGWQAVKSVVQWWDRAFEIQIQPLVNYYLERDHLTKQSHAAFKERRERIRDRVAQRIPLFGFYRDLLRWL